MSVDFESTRISADLEVSWLPEPWRPREGHDPQLVRDGKPLSLIGGSDRLSANRSSDVTERSTAIGYFT